MSASKSVHQQAITAAIKSPYAFLVYMGAGLYYISTFSPEQRGNIAAFIEILNNPAGYSFLLFIGLVLVYGLFFFPVGHFLGKHVTTAFRGVEAHYKSHEDTARRAEEHHRQAEDHYRETKILIESVQRLAASQQHLTDNCRVIVEKFEK